MTYLLGIDLGTSSVKVAIIDSQTLTAVAVSTIEYRTYHPQANFAEQSPDEWWQAIVQATRNVVDESTISDITGIGISGQMHGIVCLDANCQPLQDAIIWADGRSINQTNVLHEMQAKFNATLPGVPAVGFAASSALWLKTNRPSLLEQTHMWCLPKDYINLKLTGNVATEPSDASSTWLFDVQVQDWAKDVYEFCGLRKSQMPPIVSSSSIVGHLSKRAAAEVGLKAGIPVVAGSADLPAQALGQGVISSDISLIVVGTGGQIFIPTHSPIIDKDNRYYLFNHNQHDTWYVQAAILAGGLALRWLRNILGLTDSKNAYETLSQMAATIPAGSEGLIFLPYLAGERSPHMDAQASGLFFGLKLHHSSAHLVRAVMEGVAFALRDCMLATPYQQIEKSILSGGIAKIGRAHV